MEAVLALLAILVTAVATVVYAALTLLILWEMRAQRLEARVEILPQPWDKGPMYLVVDLENHGPAIATDVTFLLDLLKQGQPVAGSHRAMHQAVLSPGRRRRFLPRTDQVRSLNDLVSEDLVLQVVWEWRDGRRTLRRRPVTHHREIVRPLSEIAAGYYDGGALVEHDESHWLEEISKHTKKVADAN